MSYHGDKIRQTDLNEMFRLRDEDKLVDNIVEIELDIEKPARVQETDKRNILIQDAEDHGCSHVIVIDSDEYYTKKSFDYALRQIDENDYECTYCQYVNYFKDYTHTLVYPFSQGMYVPFVSKVKYRHSFDCLDFNKPSDPTRRYVLPYDSVETRKDNKGNDVEVKHYTVTPHIFEWNEVKMHHLSWLRADIRQKLNDWSSKKVFDNYNDLIDEAVESYDNFDANMKEGKIKMLFNTPDHTVDVVSLPKQYIHPAVDFNTRLRPTKEYKKMLFLSMSANMAPFEQLEDVCNKTWRNVEHDKYGNIDAEFWTYTDAADGEHTHIDSENHIIYLELRNKTKVNDRIEATYSKTVEALHIINEELKLDYDYLIRTNNSTWLNVPLINEILAHCNDDSKFYGGTLFSAYYSAFNIFCGGNLMVFSRRNVDVVLKECGSVEDAVAFESKYCGCDDNLIFGKLNSRNMRLKIPYDKVYHSWGLTYHNKRNVREDDVDVACVAHQIKTEDCKANERAQFDIKKMEVVDSVWRSDAWDIEGLYNDWLSDYFDKTITVIKPSKQESLRMNKKVLENLKYTSQMDRDEAFTFLQTHQTKCGYKAALFKKS